MKSLFYLLCIALFTHCTSKNNVDVLIVGGGASGTATAVTAARMGVSVMMVENTDWLGGMLTAAGVSAVDGNYNLPSGFFGEFCDSLALRYGGKDSLKTGWVSNVLFEPHVGSQVLQNITKALPNLQIKFKTTATNFVRQKNGWKVTVAENGKEITVETKILIDATELGDVAKSVGVKYDIGMDARNESGESIAPEQANDIIQDLTYVAVLKDFGKDVDKTISRPENYDPAPFYCACKTVQCTNPKEKQRVWSCDEMLDYGKLPNNKYMINWPIEGNDYYVNIIEMTPQQRDSALQRAKDFTLSFLYYIQTELGYKNLGLADDEYPTADLLPYIPYHRESRRIKGKVRFTVNHVDKPFYQSQPLYRTGIAVGDYPVDHHHARYPEWHKLPDLHFYPVPSYNLPLGTLIPKEVENLIVAEKSISVSNLINGSTRLQPVVLQIGQAAGTLAALAVLQNKKIENVKVRDVQQQILTDKGYIMPYLDLPKEHQHFKALQRIGATGILKGTGMNVGWSNQTWFFADSLLTTDDIKVGLAEVYPDFKFDYGNTKYVTLKDAVQMVTELSKKQIKPEDIQNKNSKEYITRGEMAVLLDIYLNPFAVDVDIEGNYCHKNK